MTEIYSVDCEVKVEADSPEEAQARAKAFLDQLDESEIWSSEVGIAVKDVAETTEYRRLNPEEPHDIQQSYAGAP